MRAASSLQQSSNVRRIGPQKAPASVRPPVVAALHACRGHFAVAFAFSLAANILYLAAPLYMIQLSDRVIGSGSVVTLLMLTLVLLVALAAQSALEGIRTLLLGRAALRFDRRLRKPVLDLALAATANPATRSGPLRDLDAMRHLIAGPAAAALCDLPWTPPYLLMIALLHPALGVFATLCAAWLIVGALAHERWLRREHEAGQAQLARQHATNEVRLRQAGLLRAMGAHRQVLEIWSDERDEQLAEQQAVATRSVVFVGIIKFSRLAMQSLILGLGAWLVIEKAINPGVMFAASMLLARALQPLEQLSSAMRQVQAARAQFRRLSASLGTAERRHWHGGQLPKLQGRLSVAALGFVHPGAARPSLYSVSFEVAAGTVTCVVGGSGSGKSTLAGLLVGAVLPAAGAVAIDGVDLGRLPDEVRSAGIGYLPQAAELYPGTIAENIGGFRERHSGEIVAAAKLLGIHETILRQPAGYATDIADPAVALPRGLQQRLALARAMCGRPALVVLDEPHTGLDAEGDAVLAAALKQLRAQSTTVVIVSHRAEHLGPIDQIIVLRAGTIASFGRPRDVLGRLTNERTAALDAQRTARRS